MRRQLEGVKRVKKKLADGSIVEYIYDRKTGVRLEGTPGTPEFAANRISAKNESFLRLAPKDNFAALIREYEQSADFVDLADNTKRHRTRRLRRIEDQWGGVPQAALTDIEFKRDFLAWRRELASAGHLCETDAIVGVASLVLRWAARQAIIATNVLADIGTLYASDRSDIVWLPQHVEVFEAVAHPRSNRRARQLLHRALILALHTGQRENDILSLKRSQYDGRYIRLTQHKSIRRGVHAKGTKPRHLEIPCTAFLRSYLDTLPDDSELFVPSITGRLWDDRNFRSEWALARDEAGLNSVTFPGREEPVSLHFHDLRGTAVTMLAEANCTESQIASITGHSLDQAGKILRRYTNLTRQLAEQAIEKYEQHPRVRA